MSLCGDVKLSPNLVLLDVLYVPQYKFNLLSVNTLTLGTQLNRSLFRDHFNTQENTTKRMIRKGDKVQGLYVLDTRNFHSFPHTFVCHVSAHIWHNRLGHLSFKRLDVLRDQVGYDISQLNKHLPRYVCPISKQRRLSFESNNKLSSRPFDPLH